MADVWTGASVLLAVLIPLSGVMSGVGFGASVALVLLGLGAWRSIRGAASPRHGALG